MGNIFRTSNPLPSKPIPPEDLWLQNQTFRIRDEVYTLIDRRGGGSFGSVWSSATPQGRSAAIKVFDLNRLRHGVDTTRLIKSFQDEVEMIYRMRGAGQYVVSVYGFDFDIQRRVALLAMELGGESLEDRAHRLHFMNIQTRMMGDDFIPARDRKQFWFQLVNIIIVLHNYNIVHRDLKPANFVFFGPILKVIDLGIAQKEVSRYGFQQRQGIGGTQFFSAPECFTGLFPITSKADIWSLGSILYFLTYGQPPFFQSSRPIPNVPPTQSPLVQQILYACLHKNPNKRPSHHWLALHPYTNSNAII